MLCIPVFFSSLWSGDSAFLFRDLFLFHYPLRYYWVTGLQGGSLPFLNAALNGGVPILANPNYGIFYPGNILYFVLPFDLAWNLTLAGHILWAGIGFYWLAKKIGCTESGALSGAVCFAFSGPVLSSLNYYNLLLTLSWIPWILGFVRKALREDGRWVVAAVLALSAQFLAGEPTIELGTFLLVLALVITTLRSAPDRKSVARRLTIIVLGTLLCCAVQWLPTLLWLPETSRAGGLDFRQSAAYWSLHPGRLFELMVPNFYGSPMSPFASDFWGGSLSDEGYPYFPRIYAGWLPLLLIPLAWRKKWGRFAILLSVGAAALSLGHYLPGYHFLYKYFFPLQIVRYPEKFTVFLALGLSFITAFGVSQIKKESNRGPLFAGISLILLSTGLYFLPLPYHLSGEQYQLKMAAVSNAILWLSLSLVILIVCSYGRSRKWILATLPLLLFMDLLTHTADVPQTDPVALVQEEPEILRKANELRQQAIFHLGEQQSDLYFLGGLAPQEFFQKATHPLTGIMWGITYGMTADIDRMGWQTRQRQFHELQRLFPHQGSMQILRESGIEWIVSLRPLSSPEIRFHKKIELPGYRFLYLYRPARTSFSLVRWNPGQGDLRWLQVSPHHMLIHTNSEREGTLTILRNAIPGWKAVINAEPVPTTRDKNDWLEIPVRPGVNEIDLSYEPPGLRTGAMISALGTLMILALIVL